MNSETSGGPVSLEQYYNGKTCHKEKHFALNKPYYWNATSQVNSWSLSPHKNTHSMLYNWMQHKKTKMLR